MSDLKARILEMIEAEGPMPVHQYMALCLFDPTDGYYTARQPFGRDGDFITAPEVSQMFGELAAAWMVAMWRRMGAPEDAILAEIGPGRGALMKDIVRAIGKLAPALLRQASFTLIEASPALADVQRQTLSSTPVEFIWRNSVADLPDKPLFVIGNELLDAIPARQYVKTVAGWRERCVGISGGALAWAAGAGSLDTSLLPADSGNAPEGAIFEIAPARTALVGEIAGRVARNGGAGIFFDYGHLVTALGDTLQAVLRHAYDDPLAHPGEADLTSHVDFAALAATIADSALTPRLATQGDFLIELGILERAGALGAKADKAVRERLRSEVERLVGPDDMGTLFKVLGFSSDNLPLPGFGETTPHPSFSGIVV